MRRSLLFLLMLWPLLATASKPDTPTLDAALKTAAARQLPLLVDFHAPWCYSCYYMAQHVLVGPKWQAIERRAVVVVALDADSPEGAYWKELWNVKALPSYVLFKSDRAGGVSELGRILAEQRQDEFIAQVEQILKRSSTLEDLQTAALKSGAAGVAAAREALAVHQARYDAGGLSWYRGLPEQQRKAFDADPPIVLALARLELLQAAQARDADRCQSLAPRVLAGDLACERPYEIDRWRDCAAALPAAIRQPVLQSQLSPMRNLADQHVFGKAAPCADQRSVVLGLAGLYKEMDRAREADALLRKAIARIQTKVGAGSKALAADRNLADNWRVYVETLDDQAGIDQLYPRLIAAYPDDYVYAFRYGRNLLARGDPEKALPYLEQSAQKAYGQNRLKVAEQRVKALRALDRDAQARQVASEVLQANGPWFAEDAAHLKASLSAAP